jgi:hypothetical protein
MSRNGRRRGSHPVAITTIVMLLALLGLGGCSRSPQVLKSGECKTGDPLAGVYLPSRLAVKNACTTVAGTVDCVKHELDGDYHVRLRPDAAYRQLLTAANAFQQCADQKDPHLVVEIIPQSGDGPFEDNSATTGGFITPVAPAAGDHIVVTGPLVWDNNVLHDLIYPGRNVKDWAEIHPAWNITVDQAASPAASH